MARRKWVERDHPRHPGGSEQGGRFRDRVGSGGWAAKISRAIGSRRGGRDFDPMRGVPLAEETDRSWLGGDPSPPRSDGSFDSLPDDSIHGAGVKRIGAGELADNPERYVDNEEFEVYDPDAGVWGTLRDAFTDDRGSVSYDDGDTPERYVELEGDGFHFTADPGEPVMIRRKRGSDPYGPEYQRRVSDAGGIFDPGSDPRSVRGVQVQIADNDTGEDVTTEAGARAAMSQALGKDYRGELEHHGGGGWMVDFPGEDADELIDNGYWGRENEDGYSLEAEWPSGADDPRAADADRADEQMRRELAAENNAEFGGEAELEAGFARAGRLSNQEVAAALAPQGRTKANRTQDRYNQKVVEEALAAHAENDDEPDVELEAQIAIVQRLKRDKKYAELDRAVDHLRRMLTISYLDEEDLPPLPPGRRSGTTGI